MGGHARELTTLAYLAGVTERIRLGTLVTGITYRNLAHLAKIVATLDVLSGGRALCGLGAGWFEREHDLYGWAFPPLRERHARLEDALQLLPLMWGPGAPRFEGRTVTVSEAVCYPRPLQERIPILVGGSGEKRLLRLVARHADACNLFGDPDNVRAKLAVLHGHCAAEGRDPAAITVTHLGAARVVRPASRAAGRGRRRSRSTSAATASSPRRGFRPPSSGSPIRTGRSPSAASPACSPPLRSSLVQAMFLHDGERVAVRHVGGALEAARRLVVFRLHGLLEQVELLARERRDARRDEALAVTHRFARWLVAAPLGPTGGRPAADAVRH